MKKLRESPINYFSDLMFAAMVIAWIFCIIVMTIAASAVTISSIILSFRTGASCIDTSMWSELGSVVTIPLASGGAIWMIKCSVQHAIFNSRNREAPKDFPAVEDAPMPPREESESIDHPETETFQP